MGPDRQPLVLKWGVIGAIVMRAVIIVFGVALMEAFQEEHDIEVEKNLVVRISRRLFPVHTEDCGEKFFHRHGSRLHATSLIVALMVVEISDLVFAVDSIPAVTPDAFIAVTSNIFAILGLRALYFLLANVVGMFHSLKYGVGLILFFVGVKMLASDFHHIGVGWSLAFICLVLAVTAVVSLVHRPQPAEMKKSNIEE